MMKGIYTLLLLLASNIFMTIAWYGHLKVKDDSASSFWQLATIIVISWCIALPEYFCQVPANRIGFAGNGGPFSLIELKVIQEVMSLVVFTVFSMIAFGMQIKWNHIAGFVCLVLAVFFIFKK